MSGLLKTRVDKQRLWIMIFCGLIAIQYYLNNVAAFHW